MLKQYKGIQPARLRIVRHQLDQQRRKLERLLRQHWAVQVRAERGDVALVEEQIDNAENRTGPLSPQ
jgi:hypothetical protein